MLDQDIQVRYPPLNMHGRTRVALWSSLDPIGIDQAIMDAELRDELLRAPSDILN